MVHFSLSTRVNFAGKRRLKFWSLQGTKSAHNLLLTVSACSLQTIIPAFAFSPLGLFRPLFFISLLGGIFLDFILLRTVLRKPQRMVTRLASGHTPSHSPLVKYLTTAFD